MQHVYIYIMKRLGMICKIVLYYVLIMGKLCIYYVLIMD